MKKKSQLILLILILFISGCSKSGIYSLIISNPGTQSESNDVNNLGNPYKNKKLVFPQSIAIMSDTERNRWLDTLNQYNIREVDTTIKIGSFKTPGLAFLKIPACAKKSIAIIVLDEVKTRKRGKLIDIKMRYVCKNDNPNINWNVLGKFWAMTPSYKIDVKDPSNECYDGFQSIEFQFSPEKNSHLLRSVLINCSKE